MDTPVKRTVIDRSGRVHGLGRIPSEPDPRDQRFPARRLFEKVPVRTEEGKPYQKWYSEVWNGDQGDTGRCAAFSMLHMLHDGPFTHRPYWEQNPLLDPTKLYRAAQCLDPWGCRTADDGTTMRAVCQAAMNEELIEHYWWFTGIEDMLSYLATRGPLLVGTWWKSEMNTPKRNPGEPDDGMVRYSGRREGGHAYKADEINWDYEYVGFKNSWGLDWGDHGRFRMSFRDFERMFAEEGEVIALTEKRIDP